MNRERVTARFLAAETDARGGSHRTAVRTRLRRVLATLGEQTDPSVATPHLLSAVAEALGDGAADRTWLTLAVLSGRLPGAAAVETVRRAARRDGPLRAVAVPLLRLRPPGRPASAWPDVQVVTGRVLVDLHHTAHADLAVGPHCVARELSARWVRDHHPALVGWTRDLGALRALDDLERAHALAGDGPPPAPFRTADATVLVPWHATYVLPEVLTEPARARALDAVLRFSHTTGAVIGYDLDPLAAAEGTAAHAGVRFTSMLTAMARSHVVAAVSDTVCEEYLGWRQMLGGAGLAGPEVVAVPLPTVATPTPTDAARRQVPAELGAGRELLVLGVGSREHPEGFLAVLHAAELVWRRGVRFSLVLVNGDAGSRDAGVGADVDAALQQLRAAGRPVRVMAAASAERLAVTYRLARCTVVPSLVGGLGLPATDSLAAHTPVIAAELGSLRDLAADGGTVLVDPGDDHALARALHQLLTDDVVHAELRSQAARRPRRTWDDYAARTWEVLTRDRAGSPLPVAARHAPTPPPGPVPVVVEVTNTLVAVSVTGYQRFVRELLAQLQVTGTPALEVLPVVWDARGRCFRRLTGAESRALREPPVPARAPAGPVWNTLLRTSTARVRRRWQRRPRAEHRALRMPQLPLGAVFFDLEPAWHDPERRADLLPRLRARGTTVVTMVADVLPEQRPEWFDPRVQRAHLDWLRSHLTCSQLCLTISEDTRRGLLEVAERDGLPAPPTQVVPLGADFEARRDGVPVELPAGTGRYLLMVGTLEPRKNHALALDLLDRISASHPDVALVLVGRPGWLVDELVERVRAHPLSGVRLLWLPSADDDHLVWLYRHAFLALAPSYSEGLGLPVMEAMRYGVPTVASTGGALPEAGGDLAEYADPDDLEAWVSHVERHLDDPLHHDRAVTRVRGYAPPTWAAAGSVVRDALVRARTADTAAPTQVPTPPTREPSS